MNTKKTFLLICLLLISLTSLFAYQDSFKASSTKPLYVKLISAIKNGESESIVLNSYNDYLNSGITPVESCRIEYHLARYYKDIKNKDEARKHISLMKSKLDSLPSSTSDFEKLVCQTEYTSADFYVDRNLSVGLNNSNLAKELYKKFPNEVFSNMNEAWRLIYSPAIAGGSPKKAIKILDGVMKDYSKNLVDLDKYSIYCAYAIAENKRENYQEADEYFNKAFKYFTKETEIVSAYNENKQELNRQGDN